MSKMSSRKQFIKGHSVAGSSTQPPADSVVGVIVGKVAKSRDGVVTIAPGIAQRLLDECNFSGQRRLQPARVLRHKNRILNGDWNPDVSVITLAKTPDGKLHNVNGQHRLAAISASKASVDTRVVIASASSEDEVRRMYAAFDAPDSNRPDSEMLIGIDAPGKLGVSNKIAFALFRATSLLMNDLEPMAGSASATFEARERDNKLKAMTEWRDEAVAFANCIKSADSNIARALMTQGVMASALYTLRHKPRIAAEFWSGLASNDGLRRSDPRSRLLSDFNNRKANSGSIRQRVQRVAIAWNAHYRGRELKIIKCIDGADIVFLGTPKGAR